MSCRILALLCLVALLGRAAIVTAAPVADESLEAALETGSEISAAVENEINELEVVENVEEDKRQGYEPPGGHLTIQYNTAFIKRPSKHHSAEQKKTSINANTNKKQNR